MRINSDGTIGNWSTTTAFATGRNTLTSVAYNGYLYVIGGSTCDANCSLNDVQYAPINQDGSIGTWNSTTSMPTSRFGAASIVHNGYLYVTGGWSGWSGNISYNDVHYAKINSDGSVGTWSTSTYQYINGGYGHTNEIYNNSKPLYNKTGGDVSYKSFKNSTGENQIVHHNVNKLYNKDKMTPENIDKII